MVERLKALQRSRGQFTNGSELSDRLLSDNTLKKEVEELYNLLFDRKIHGCNNCYVDAFIELVNINIEKIMNKVERKFTLRNGALLRDKGGNSKYLCSNANLTDELALYHLKTNPNCIDFFEKYPDNYIELVNAFELSNIEQNTLAASTSEDTEKLQNAEARIQELEKVNEVNQGYILNKDNQIAIQEEQLNRTQGIVKAFLSNNIEDAIALLSKDEIIILTKHHDLDVEIAEDMNDVDTRNTVLALLKTDEEALQGVIQTDSLDEDTQAEIEKRFVIEIAEKLKAGALKKEIQEEYKTVEKIGEKNLTVRFLSELISIAEERIKV